jgi:hypothetical protein
MSKESRKKLASLSFSEKVKLLEKLRARSLALAEAGKKLKEKREKQSPSWEKPNLTADERG